jgi:hypothetical protein
MQHEWKRWEIHAEVSPKNLKGKHHLEDISVVLRTILKLILGHSKA